MVSCRFALSIEPFGGQKWVFGFNLARREPCLRNCTGLRTRNRQEEGLNFDCEARFRFSWSWGSLGLLLPLVPFLPWPCLSPIHILLTTGKLRTQSSSSLGHLPPHGQQGGVEVKGSVSFQKHPSFSRGRWTGECWGMGWSSMCQETAS